MKKLLAIIMTFMMCLLVFVGCGDNGSSESVDLKIGSYFNGKAKDIKSLKNFNYNKLKCELDIPDLSSQGFGTINYEATFGKLKDEEIINSKLKMGIMDLTINAFSNDKGVVLSIPEISKDYLKISADSIKNLGGNSLGEENIKMPDLKNLDAEKIMLRIKEYLKLLLEKTDDTKTDKNFTLKSGDVSQKCIKTERVYKSATLYKNIKKVVDELKKDKDLNDVIKAFNNNEDVNWDDALGSIDDEIADAKDTDVLKVVTYTDKDGKLYGLDATVEDKDGVLGSARCVFIKNDKNFSIDVSVKEKSTEDLAVKGNGTVKNGACTGTITAKFENSDDITLKLLDFKISDDFGISGKAYLQFRDNDKDYQVTFQGKNDKDKLSGSLQVNQNGSSLFRFKYELSNDKSAKVVKDYDEKNKTYDASDEEQLKQYLDKSAIGKSILGSLDGFGSGGSSFDEDDDLDTDFDEDTDDDTDTDFDDDTDDDTDFDDDDVQDTDGFNFDEDSLNKLLGNACIMK